MMSTVKFHIPSKSRCTSPKQMKIPFLLLHSNCLHLCCICNLCLTSVHMHCCAVFSCMITDQLFHWTPAFFSVKDEQPSLNESLFIILFRVTSTLFTTCYSNPAEAVIIHFLTFFFLRHPSLQYHYCNFSSVLQITKVRQRDVCPPHLPGEHQGRGRFRLEEDTPGCGFIFG